MRRLIIDRPSSNSRFAEYEEQLRVNAAPASRSAQAVARPGMIGRGLRQDREFLFGDPEWRRRGLQPYVASRRARSTRLTKALARELGRHGMRVNAISPGAVVLEAEDRVFGRP